MSRRRDYEELSDIEFDAETTERVEKAVAQVEQDLDSDHFDKRLTEHFSHSVSKEIQKHHKAGNPVTQVIDGALYRIWPDGSREKVSKE